MGATKDSHVFNDVGLAIALAVTENGGTNEDTKRVLNDEELCNKIAALILQKEEVASAPLRRLFTCDPTGRGTFSVYEQTRTATFGEIVRFFRTDFSELCFNQGSLEDFDDKYPSCISDEGLTLFLVKEGENFKVRVVKVVAGGLVAHYRSIESTFLLNKEHPCRIVVRGDH